MSSRAQLATADGAPWLALIAALAAAGMSVAVLLFWSVAGPASREAAALVLDLSKPSTAMAVALAAAALAVPRRDPRLAGLATACGALVSAIGVARLLGYALGVDFDLDSRLIGLLHVGETPPVAGSMTTATAACLAPLGIALAFVHRVALHRVVEIGATAVGALALAVVLMETLAASTGLSFRVTAEMPAMSALMVAVLSAGTLSAIPGGSWLIATANAAASRDAVVARHERILALAESDVIGFALVEHGQVREVNDAWARLLGYSGKEWTTGAISPESLGVPLWDSPRRATVVRKDGVIVHVLTARFSIGYGRSVALVADCSDRRSAEAVLRRLRHVLDA